MYTRGLIPRNFAESDEAVSITSKHGVPKECTFGPSVNNLKFYLSCLLRQKRSSEKKIQFYLDIVTCGPSII